MKDENPNIQWDRIFYGRKLMQQILTTIETKDILSGIYFKRYLLRAMMAGFIIGIMLLLTLKFRADMAFLSPGQVSLGAGILFGFALVFILFTNSELLTSNFMYFTVGLYYKKIKMGTVSKIFFLCFMGNLIGGTLLFALVRLSSIMTPEMNDILLQMVLTKSESMTMMDIFIRAIFANFFINISVVIAMQLDSALPKMFVLTLGVFIFAYMGYEHVIANAALFAGALIYDFADVNVLQLLKNLFFAFWGNYVGGGLIIGLFYAYLNDHRRLSEDKVRYKR